MLTALSESTFDKILQSGLNAIEQARQEERARWSEALIAMVYVHPCNCGEGIPEGQCARCRAVALLGFDPAQS